MKIYLLDKHVSIINLCLEHSLFTAITQNPIQNSHRLFVEATRVMQISRLPYKKHVISTTL